MAVIGDVLVKLQADFAEFAKGMDASSQKLDQFGKQAGQTNSLLEGFQNKLVGLAKAAIGVFSIQQIAAMTEAIVKQALEIEKLGEKYKLTSEQVQAIQAQAKETGRSFDELAKYYQQHTDQLYKVEAAAKLTGQTMSGELTGAIKNVAN